MKEIAESRHHCLEQGAQDARSSLGEFAPELRFVSPNLGCDTQELDDQRTVEKIGPCSAEVGNSVEDQRAGGIENGFIVVAIKLPATEASTRREPAGSIGQILGQAAQVIETHEPGVSRCCGEITHLARDASERRGARVNERTDHAACGRLAGALLALGDQNR
jgi:hypothetical protein